MQRLVLGLLALALLGAGATVLLVDRYIDRQTQTAAKVTDQSSDTRVVLVAKENLPIGKKIEGGDLQWISWPKEGVQSHFTAAPKPDGAKAKKFVGTIARRGIIKGTPMTDAAVFRTATPGFLAGALDPNMRAVSISVNATSGASGFIMPGDRVDVILMQDAQRNSGSKASAEQEGFRPFIRHTAETVLHNIRVLAVDQQVDDFEKKAKVSKTVTVEVTPKQAEALVVASAMGKMSLALRSLLGDKSLAASDAGEPAGLTSGPESTIGMAKSAAGGGKIAEGPTVTTDIEISPILAATIATASGSAKAREAVPAKKTTRTAAPRAQIKIYRAGQPSTVNF